jgi:FMN phosphatase YigB (HAD superfamily)
MKRAYIFDFDETLVTTEARIHVYKNGAHVGEMNSKEFNFYKPKPGETLDFTEFKDGELIMNAKRYKMWPVLRNVNKAVKEERSTSDIYILTARSPLVKSYIYEFLKKHGIEIDIEHIVTIGDDKGDISISEEKRKWLKKIVFKYDDIIFFDDDPKNITMAGAIKGIRTRLVENKILNHNMAKLVREDMGGVGAPMATAMNTPGMGNVTPAGPGTIGSGDKFGNTVGKKLYTQGKTKKKKPVKKKKLEEENINPYDKIGMAMAKKMGVKPPFKKKKSKGNQNAMVQQKFEHQIISLDEFTKLINEGESPLYDARQDWKDMMKRDKKSLLGELSQLYRVNSQSEKDSKGEIIAAILDAKHSRWSAESSDFKNK